MSTQNSTPAKWLLYCRPGFERDCQQETQAKPLEGTTDSGFVIVEGKPGLRFANLAFARQLLRLTGEISSLPERDRLTPILDSLPGRSAQFSSLFLETPDTNEGKTLSAFIRRFQPLLEEQLRIRRQLVDDTSLPRLHLFFASKQRVLIGTSDPLNSSPALMGIMRMRMPHEAPSRSTLKLAEAFETFLTAEEKKRWLKPGMNAVDLGAAPGGWTWQLLQLGMKVTAIDNGPLKGTVAQHPAVRHLREDGFRFRPRQPVDWLVCDMIERPAKVAALITEWITSGKTQRAIFNLKLPMKKRVEALEQSLEEIRTVLNKKNIKYRLQAKQLYHDREEVTVLLART